MTAPSEREVIEAKLAELVELLGYDADAGRDSIAQLASEAIERLRDLRRADVETVRAELTYGNHTPLPCRACDALKALDRLEGEP